MPIEVRGPRDRFVTVADGHTTWHSFSFGVHYDPHNTGFGALVAHNDEVLPAGTGFPDHPHVDTEIVTWVLSGALRHTDSARNTGVVVPGQVQLLSAGTGVVHSEVADGAEQTRFLQAWVRPDESGLVPSYAAAEPEPVRNALTCLADGDGGGAIDLHARGASLHAGDFDAGAAVPLPDAPRLHVFIAAGAATLGDREIPAGGAGRLVHEGGRLLTATRPDTSVVVWALP